MKARLRKKYPSNSSEAAMPVQAQFQSRSLRDSAQTAQTHLPAENQAGLPLVQRQLEQAQSFGHNFGQLEVQPVTPTVIQLKPIIGRSLENSEREGDRAGEQLVGEINAPAQLTRIQGQPVHRQRREESQTNTPNSLLKDGIVPFSVISDYCDTVLVQDVEKLNPESHVVENILKYPLKQSWHLAKQELALSDSPVRLALMKKLIEFRQWHHQEILKKTQKEINEKYGERGLLPSKGGGSETLTSDIDVNLKGTHTEEAVKVFNRLFKADGWGYESGVVYDVNVYAVDFMHQFGGETLREGVGKPEQSVTVKEGARGILSQGGFGDNNSEIAKADRKEQEEWALVKLRLYMTVQQWKTYCSQSKISPETVKGVEEKYAEYLKNMGDEMYKNTSLKGAGIKQSHLNESGIEKINDKAEMLTKVKLTVDRENQEEKQEVMAEELKMKASNRLYENKLKKVTGLRQQSEYNNLLGLANLPFFEEEGNVELEKKIKGIRSHVSEAALYANEAYVTDAAVYHAVVGLQAGKQIQQTKAELMNVVTENLADALKEIARHGSSLGEAAYKAGKYYMRMTDAAKNMGLGKVEGVEGLYKAGYEISVEHKNQSNWSEEEKQKESSKSLSALGINNVDALKNRIIEVATNIRKAFNRQGESEKQKLGQAGPKKNELNVN